MFLFSVCLVGQSPAYGHKMVEVYCKLPESESIGNSTRIKVLRDGIEKPAYLNITTGEVQFGDSLQQSENISYLVIVISGGIGNKLNFPLVNGKFFFSVIFSDS